MVLVVIALLFLLFNPIFIRYFYTEAATVSRVAKVNYFNDEIFMWFTLILFFLGFAYSWSLTCSFSNSINW